MYNDLNGCLNYAGTAINMASRVMGVVKNANQVAITKEAYSFIDDFYSNLCDQFREYKSVAIKHNVKIDLYQYIAASMEKIGLCTTQLDLALGNLQSSTDISSQIKEKDKKPSDRWAKLT